MALNPGLILPARIDNCYSGHWLGLVLFAGLQAVTLWRSLHHMLAPDGGAQSIATIPLDSYPAAAAGTVVGVFALWGLSQLIVALVGLVALWRYRALIPLLSVLIVVEYAVRAALPAFKPIETVGTAPGAAANLPMVALGLVLVLLGCWVRSPARG